MDEGNSAAENGVEGGVSYVETNNVGTVTTKQFLELENSDPSQAAKKCRYSLSCFLNSLRNFFSLRNS